jgi:uncharacterized membrane protein YeaQ/YmgE (transglycosylase-associated protein family)
MLFGSAVGIVAGVLMPGHDPGGVVAAAALGAFGATSGGFIGRVLGMYQPGEVAGVIEATLGALLIVVVYRPIAANS